MTLALGSKWSVKLPAILSILISLRPALSKIRLVTSVAVTEREEKTLLYLLNVLFTAICAKSEIIIAGNT